jgi:type VI secretion system secreted protein Hcp
MSIYILFEGISGECTKNAYKGYSDAESLTLATDKPSEGATGQARRRGDVKFNDLEIERLLDSSSPSLMRAVATAKIIPNIYIDLTNSYTSLGSTSQTELVTMRILLNDAIVSSYSLSINPDGPPTETINVNYARIAVKYFPQNSSGADQAAVVFNWDCEAVNEWNPAPRI